MSISRSEAVLAYMQACVRLHAADARHVDLWPAEQIVSAFHALPGPVASMDAWIRGMALNIEPGEQQIEQHNEQAISKLNLAAKAGLAPVIVEDNKTESES